MRTTGVSVFGARPVWLVALLRRALEQVAALFMHGEHRALAGDTWHRRSDDRAALVEDQLEFNALFFKILQRQRDAVAADLLIVGGGEPQVAGRLEALPRAAPQKP